MEPLVHTEETARSNVSLLELDECSPLQTVKEPITEDNHMIKNSESSDSLKVNDTEGRRNSYYICRKSSINLIQEMVWSKQVGNIDLFKSQQIFYRLLQKSQSNKSARFHNVR